MAVKIQNHDSSGEGNGWERGMRDTSGDIDNVYYHHLSASYMSVFTKKSQTKCNLWTFIYTSIKKVSPPKKKFKM